MDATPEAEHLESEGLSREAFADRAGRIVGPAAETFNDGLRCLGPHQSGAVSRARRSPLNCHCASGGKKLR
jgi:hypothetical protein